MGVVGALGVLFLIIFRRAQAKKSGVFRSDSFVFDTNPGLGSPKGDSSKFFFSNFYDFNLESKDSSLICCTAHSILVDFWVHGDSSLTHE